MEYILIIILVLFMPFVGIVLRQLVKKNTNKVEVLRAEANEYSLFDKEILDLFKNQDYNDDYQVSLAPSGVVCSHNCRMTYDKLSPERRRYFLTGSGTSS